MSPSLVMEIDDALSGHSILWAILDNPYTFVIAHYCIKNCVAITAKLPSFPMPIEMMPKSIVLLDVSAPQSTETPVEEYQDTSCEVSYSNVNS